MSLKKLLAAMFLQKKPIMQILAANILMGIFIVKETSQSQSNLAELLAWIKFVFLLNVKKFILYSG